MDDRIIQSVAELPKVCEHINLPVQAGDDEVLRRMRRPYNRDDYRELVGRIRDTVPGVSLSTDIIVGFPGETEEQYQRTLDLVAELRFDKVHCAAYSTRPGTIADRTLPDDVPAAEKQRRLQELDALQESIARESNAALVGSTVETLVEGRKGGKWRGRTRTDKLVFFGDTDEAAGGLPGAVGGGSGYAGGGVEFGGGSGGVSPHYRKGARTMPYCTACGGQVAENANFCTHCGKANSGMAAAPTINLSGDKEACINEEWNNLAPADWDSKKHADERAMLSGLLEYDEHLECLVSGDFKPEGKLASHQLGCCH